MLTTKLHTLSYTPISTSQVLSALALYVMLYVNLNDSETSMLSSVLSLRYYLSNYHYILTGCALVSLHQGILHYWLMKSVNAVHFLNNSYFSCCCVCSLSSNCYGFLRKYVWITIDLNIYILVLNLNWLFRLEVQNLDD